MMRASLMRQVMMAKELALYLLKQGKYNQEGDIVILVNRPSCTSDKTDAQCAYLGCVTSG